MIKVESNVKDIIKRLKARKANSNNDLAQKVALRIAEKVKALLIETYRHTKSEWAEEGSALENLSGEDVTISLENNKYIIKIGEQTPMIALDGYNGLPTSANPYFFIEFGFGIVGEQKPVTNATKKSWAYNVRNHQEAWAFRGTDGNLYWSEGIEGANAMGVVEAQYAKLCKEAIDEVMAKAK